MVKIRLTRIGKKHQPSYRIVATDKANPVAGEYLELIGTYNPIRSLLDVNKEKALNWLNKGAQPSERVARLFKQSGLEHKSIVIKHYKPKKLETPANAETLGEKTEETVSEESKIVVTS